MCFGTLTGLTFLVANPRQRVPIGCDIVSQKNASFDCSWMYGRGPEWCRAEQSSGLYISIRYNEQILPICASSCNCWDQNGFHDLTPATNDCLLVPVNTIVTNETMCFVDEVKERAYLHPLGTNIGSYIALGFWWFFGCGCFIGLCCVWCDDNKDPLPFPPF